METKQKKRLRIFWKVPPQRIRKRRFLGAKRWKCSLTICSIFSPRLSERLLHCTCAGFPISRSAMKSAVPESVSTIRFSVSRKNWSPDTSPDNDRSLFHFFLVSREFLPFREQVFQFVNELEKYRLNSRFT